MNRRELFKSAAALGVVSACGSSSETPGPTGCAPTSQCAGLPAPEYFDTLSAQLKEKVGTPVMLLDLDALDNNAATIVKGAKPERYRIVEKSLPSLDVLKYVKQQTGSNRFLVLHLPFLREILEAIPDAQVLIGKSQPPKAIANFLAAANPADAARVTWLVDKADWLNQMITIAGGTKIRVAVEIDVGLHRGGVRTPDLLPELLKIFTANPDLLTFAGFLGYDGHVVGAPSVPGLELRTIKAAFNTAQDTYQSFKDVLKQQQFVSLVRDDLIFNSGGSETYSQYPDDGPVNDVAAGGGMTRPSTYTSPFLGPLVPATFIATPVLAHYDRLELPFVTDISQSQSDNGQGFTMYGGGWPANPVYPVGVSAAPFVSDGLGINQVPNQSWMYGPASPTINPGDWIFFHPIMGDAIIQFEDMHLVRGGQLTGETWKPFPSRF